MDEIMKLQEEIKKIMEELFGSCEDDNGILRSMAEHMGVTDVGALVEIALENGGDSLGGDFLFPVVNFHLTLATDIEDEVIPNLLISLNALNHEISAGAFPSLGTFVYYPPLNQVYLSYRLPVCAEGDIETNLTNIRFVFSLLYEQLDLFMDLIIFTVNSLEGITIGEYMEYLDEVSDLNDLTARSEVLKQHFDQLLESGAENEDWRRKGDE